MEQNHKHGQSGGNKMTNKKNSGFFMSILSKIGTSAMLFIFVLSMVSTVFAQDSASTASTSDTANPSESTADTMEGGRLGEDLNALTKEDLKRIEEQKRLMEKQRLLAAKEQYRTKIDATKLALEQKVTAGAAGGEYAKNLLAKSRESNVILAKEKLEARQKLAEVKSEIGAFTRLKIKCEQADDTTQECADFRAKMQAQAEILKKKYAEKYAEDQKQALSLLLNKIAEVNGEKSKDDILSLATTAEELTKATNELSRASTDKSAEITSKITKQVEIARLKYRYQELKLRIEKYSEFTSRLKLSIEKVSLLAQKLAENGVEVPAEYKEKLASLDERIKNIESYVASAKKNLEEIESIIASRTQNTDSAALPVISADSTTYSQYTKEDYQKVKTLYKEAHESLVKAKKEFAESNSQIKDVVQYLKAKYKLRNTDNSNANGIGTGATNGGEAVVVESTTGSEATA